MDAVVWLSQPLPSPRPPDGPSLSLETSVSNKTRSFAIDNAQTWKGKKKKKKKEEQPPNKQQRPEEEAGTADWSESAG